MGNLGTHYLQLTSEAGASLGWLCPYPLGSAPPPGSKCQNCLVWKIHISGHRSVVNVKGKESSGFFPGIYKYPHLRGNLVTTEYLGGVTGSFPPEIFRDSLIQRSGFNF